MEDRQRQLNIVEDIMRPRIGYENLLIDCHLVTRDALKVYSLHLRHDLSLFHSRLAKNFVWLYDRLVQLKLWAKRSQLLAVVKKN